METSGAMTGFRSACKHFFGFTFVATLLGVATMGFVVLQSGNARASTFCIAAVYLTYWPMLLLGFDVHNMFTSLPVVGLNAVAWGAIGLIIALLRKNSGNT
jgi:ABC-type proline/glycine betaine transport system permease subunit